MIYTIPIFDNDYDAHSSQSGLISAFSVSIYLRNHKLYY